MEIRKAIKKVVALSAGVTMLGATLMGAMAADLSAYPSPFVKDGQADTVVVVGEKAMTEDVVGAIDIAASLQAAAVSQVPVTVSGTGISVIGGKDAEIAVDEELADGLGTSVDDGDVAGLLDTKVDFDGDDVDVSESIIFGSGNTLMTSEDSDEDFELNPFIGIKGDEMTYQYSIDESSFNATLVGHADGDNLEIVFAGKSLEITALDFDGTMTVKSSQEYYAAVGDVINVDGHSVTLINVGLSAVVVKVDGQTKTISLTDGVGDTSFDEAGDYKVEVSDVFYVDEKEDRSVTLALGDDITQDVQSGDCMEIFGEPDEDCQWEWQIGPGKVIEAVYTEDRLNTDDDYAPLGVGDKFMFINDYAYLSFDSLTNTEYEKVTMTFESGEDLDNGGSSTDYDALVFSAVEDVFVVGNEQTAKIWITIDPADNETTQVWYKDDTEEILSGETMFQIRVDDENINVSFGNWSETLTNVTFDFIDDTSAEDINIGITTGAGEHNNSAGMVPKSFGSQDSDADSEDLYIGVNSEGTRDSDILTSYGVKITDPEAQFDDGTDFEFEVPREQLKANVVVGTSATSVAGTSGTATSDKVNAISVGLGVLDKDVTVGSQNMIVVGGPCVNTIAAELMGNPANCVEGFEMGKAMIKLYESNGKTAMLVAGYSALDTQGATRVVSQYDMYDLSGSEASVTVTSLSNINVE